MEKSFKSKDKTLKAVLFPIKNIFQPFTIMLLKELSFDFLKFLFGVPTPGGLELFEALDALLHTVLAVDFVVSGAYVHCVACLLLLSHHQDEVILRQLCISDLFVQGAAGVEIHVSHEAAAVEFLLDFLSILFTGWSHGYDHHLTRREPQRPFAPVVFSENSDHPLY